MKHSRSNWKIPNNWSKITLGEFRINKVETVEPKQFPDEWFELYSVPSCEIGRPEFVQGKNIGSRKQIVEEGTVLLCKINPHINRTWVVDNYSQFRKIASTEWISFCPLSGVEPRFLKYYMSLNDFRQYLVENVSGVGGSLMRIRPKALDDYEFPLPPLPEQHRIVAKIEELFSRLDAGVEALKKAKNLLEQFRRSLFRDAFTGKLTAQLRSSMRYCPTNQVYYSIPLSNIEDVELHDLPIGWRWVSLGDVGEISGGITKNRNRKRFDRIVPYLRVANVYANMLDLRKIKTIGVTKEEFERALLKEGDLLVVEGNGSLDQIGRVALWDGSIPNCVHQNHLIKVRFYDKSLKKYVLYWLLSTQGRDFIIRIASSTSGLYTLSISKVASLPIPLCPAIEREKIVMEIERQTAVFDYIQEILIKQLTKAAQLKQSILSKAFEGSLVPQDPLDESASLLLERIRSKQIK